MTRRADFTFLNIRENSIEIGIIEVIGLLLIYLSTLGNDSRIVCHHLSELVRTNKYPRAIFIFILFRYSQPYYAGIITKSANQSSLRITNRHNITHIAISYSSFWP